IKIASEVFDLEVDKKKKKLVLLEWPKLKAIRDQLDRETFGLYKSVKGVVRIGHQRLLDGEKLDVILRIASWLDPERDLAREWPRKRNFDAGEGLHELLSSLDHVLQIARARDRTAELGFVTLYTDAEGMFWFRCSRGFHTALSESLASLEALADRIGGDGAEGAAASPEERERVNSLYRKLSSFFD
ncbi:MAG TPA: ATP-dependent RNA helicase, partial [Rectinemataceae bacterium]|nr:ATP-dependent RNA helicase [Rectinemataceae bacterium]